MSTRPRDVQFRTAGASFPGVIVLSGNNSTSQGLDHTYLRARVVETEEGWPGYGDEFTWSQVFIRGLPEWHQPAYKEVRYYVPTDIEENEILPFPLPDSPKGYLYHPVSYGTIKAGLHLTACGWQVRLREVDAFRNKNKSVSYEGSISRSDGSPVSLADGESFSLAKYLDFVRSLEMFLSFIAGDFRFFSGNILRQLDTDDRILSSCRFRFNTSPDSHIGHQFLKVEVPNQYDPLFELADAFIHTYMERDDFKTLVQTFVAGQKAYNDGLGHYATDLVCASVEALARIDGGKGKPVGVRYLESKEGEMSALPAPWGLEESADSITWGDLWDLRNAVAHGFVTEEKVKAAVVPKLERDGCLKLQRAMMSLLICYLRRQQRG